MAISITTKTVIATYHHARQSDLDPTPLEVQAWAQILESNYAEILPREMATQGLDPNNAAMVDLALLLSELTEASGVLTKARRGCAVVAGLQRAGGAVAGNAATLEASPARVSRRRPSSARRAKKKNRRRLPSS
jgi:hypothetical protein